MRWDEYFRKRSNVGYLLKTLKITRKKRQPSTKNKTSKK